MHNVEHESSQNDSAVKMTERPAGEELQARPSPGGMTMTKKLRLPRNWRYVLAGGTVFLVLVVILASVLSSRSQPLHQPSHSRPCPYRQLCPGPYPHRQQHRSTRRYGQTTM
jgi:hypothetical protein